MRRDPRQMIPGERNTFTGLFLGLVLLVVLAGTAFASTDDVVWKHDSWALLGGAFALALAAWHTVALVAGRRAALRFLASTLGLSWLAECVGLHGGWLFSGAYRYHPDVAVVLPGGVPAFIPLAWFTLASFPVMVLRRLSPPRPEKARAGRRVLDKSARAAIAMVACDLSLDPVAVSLGLWSWEQPGSYFGVPWMNFAGWWVVAFVIFWTGYAWMGLNPAEERPIPLRFDVAWGLAQMALLILLGIGAFHRIGSAWPLLATLAILVAVSGAWINDMYWRVRARRSTDRSIRGRPRGQPGPSCGSR